MITALSSKRIQDTQLHQRIEKANRLRRACTRSRKERCIERYRGTRYALIFQVRVSTSFVVLQRKFFFSTNALISLRNRCKAMLSKTRRATRRKHSCTGDADDKLFDYRLSSTEKSYPIRCGCVSAWSIRNRVEKSVTLIKLLKNN